MSDDYAQDYFASEPSYEDAQGQQVTPEPIQPSAPAVSYEQVVQLQQELEALKANPLQALGYQPMPQAQPKWTAEQAAISAEYLKSQNVVTRDDLMNERINDAAEEAGYIGREHLEASFRADYFTAVKAGDVQRQAELKQLSDLYTNNPRAAIKAYQQSKDRPKAPLQNQSFGHVPPSQQQTRQQPRFANNQEFLAYRRSNPVEAQKIYDEWMADTTGTKNPFPI